MNAPVACQKVGVVEGDVRYRIADWIVAVVSDVEAAVRGGDKAAIDSAIGRLRGDLSETLTKARAMLAESGDSGAESLPTATAAVRAS